MQHWKLHVTRYEGPNGLLYEISDTGRGIVTNGGTQSQLDVLGNHGPTMPNRPLTEVEFFRWKADEGEKGNQVNDWFN
jgi:hypothetical protein